MPVKLVCTDNTPMETQVLVVGAGPVGLTMAAELARYGVSVRIVDKNLERSDKSRALVIWSRTMELLDRTGCGRSFVDAGMKVTRVNLKTDHELLAHLDFEGVETSHPYALMIPQDETERLLEKHLNDLGVLVERGTTLTNLEQQPDHAVATLQLPDGSLETPSCEWLIGCDGAHSAVRQLLDLRFEGDTLLSDWILADVHLSGLEDPDQVNMFWHADGILALFPISSGRYRVIADGGASDPSTPHPPAPTLEQVQQVLDQRGPGGIALADAVWLSSFRINERKVADYRSGRAFLAGDAAHIHSPAGGQGMNTGMQDAFNLAWKLALVCQGNCLPEPILDSYSRERSAIGEQVLKDTGRMTAFAVMRGGIKQAIRNHVASVVLGFASVRRSLANTMCEVTIGYPEGPLSFDAAHFRDAPVAGERAPIPSGQTPVGYGREPLFVLAAERDDNLAGLLAKFPRLLDSNIREPFAKGGAWLVRPDGYVALVAEQGVWSEVEAYLSRFAHHQPMKP
ncbi:MAG TPA: FAD-dependent monooxygenase [Fimbriimonas sp.]|nr:FAD-dependent monooxygenase [Fimbriimonas sp.]